MGEAEIERLYALTLSLKTKLILLRLRFSICRAAGQQRGIRFKSLSASLEIFIKFGQKMIIFSRFGIIFGKIWRGFKPDYAVRKDLRT